MKEISLEEVVDIQNSVVNMPEILEAVNPDHVHWMKEDQPLFFRAIPEIISKGTNLTSGIVRRLYRWYFRIKGLQVEQRHSTLLTYFDVKPNLTPQQRGKLRFFREIDFRIGDTDFNSTRINGDENLHHLFYRDQTPFVVNELNRVGPSEQEAFSRFQAARML